MLLVRSFSLVVLSMIGQVAFCQTTAQERITTHLKAIGTSTSDVVQDSLNNLVKADLRILLDADGALIASFGDLPMTRVDAPDGAFRLFTWNLPRADGSHQFEGFVLARSARGQVLTELRDMTPKIPSPEVPELGPERWYGALYYEVIPVKKGGKEIYTLLGWKGYSRAETRKVIDVLSFRNGKPRFGAPVFGKGRLRPMRKVFGFSFQATMTLRYDPSLEAIVMDHLSPSRADMKDQWAYYGPDMSHDGYFWHKGEWWFGPEIDLRDSSSKSKVFHAPRHPEQE
ncbi:MAG: hypothetical protein IPH05_04690 [Flavobacteriales bacterium]|jgi:hypothetical protein|nr:hypothetical protein [Flavobacteriales bacterium]MBK7618721.1 hypothetical protein [Flavobacteriales bacterium]MBK8708886.1 hypothetical protein [Flavobacteriales bacterium]HQW05051.1 hypothetical protein [Flavobacteriales bacterium]HQY00592.1 hypothetical protein [Flavobacteriales bacterium]